jgi:hypothetical protein
VTTSTGGDRNAEVWAATWVLGAAPVEGLGTDEGYGLAFVRVEGGPTLQVLVEGAAAPEPGALGRVRAVAVGDEEIDVFTPGATS